MKSQVSLTYFNFNAPAISTRNLLVNNIKIFVLCTLGDRSTVSLQETD